jgi:hypothetical protein
MPVADKIKTVTHGLQATKKRLQNSMFQKGKTRHTRVPMPYLLASGAEE